MTYSLSAGQVAALINVSILLAQVTFPLILALLSVGLLKPTINAATWSVFGRLINASHWPLVLSTDTSSSERVLRRYRAISWLSNIATFLLALAAAVTPLGLHSQIKLVDQDETPFTYVKDTSPIGRSTIARASYHINRLCGYFVFQDCPGSYHGYNFSTYPNGTGSFDVENGSYVPYVSSKIPTNISAVFDSQLGSSGGTQTIANLFDIQYRSFVSVGNKTIPSKHDLKEAMVWVDGGHERTQGRFQYYQQFISNSKVEAVEGLIVSTTETPGIGFRNHTLPPASAHGRRWSEKILWLEPETVCTDLNISLRYHFTTQISPLVGYDEAYILDRGGIANNPINMTSENNTYPDDLALNAHQSNPRLREKSWIGAALTNAILTEFLNETKEDVYVGKRYSVSDLNTCALIPTLNRLDFRPYGFAGSLLDYWDPELPGALGTCTMSFRQLNVTEESHVGSVLNNVQNFTFTDAQSPHRIALGAGMVQGVAIPLDEEGRPVDYSFVTNHQYVAHWSQPFYSCVSTVKASIKNVDFEIMDDATIPNLMVKNVELESDSSFLWAIEDTGWGLRSIDPFWGPVSRSDALHEGISTFDSPSIYLPAGQSSVDPGALWAYDAKAGITGPLSALAMIYAGELDGPLTESFAAAPDYTGVNNWPLLLEWARLGGDASTASRIIDLIWTDLMANMLMGAKSPVPSGDSTVYRPSQLYISALAYDWKYASISFLFAGLYAIGLLALLMFCIFRRCNLSELRFFLNQTAAGRSVTTERYQAKSGVDFAKTEAWASVRGDEPVLVGKRDANGSSPHLVHLISKERDGSQLLAIF